MRSLLQPKACLHRRTSDETTSVPLAETGAAKPTATVTAAASFASDLLSGKDAHHRPQEILRESGCPSCDVARSSVQQEMVFHSVTSRTTAAAAACITRALVRLKAHTERERHMHSHGARGSTGCTEGVNI